MLVIRTTGIGSLPHADVEQALDHVFARYTLPFLPQIRGEERGMAPMLRESLTPEMAAALAEGDAQALHDALARATPRVAVEQWIRQPATAAFLRRMVGKAAGKLQVVGPLTAAMLIEQQLGGRPLKRGSTADAGHAAGVLSWICELSRALIGLLADVGCREITLIWDDGALPLAGDAREQQKYADALATLALGTGAHVGVHSCTPLDVTALARLLPRATLAIDLAVIDIFAPAAWDAVCAHLRRGGRFILGIYDTARATLDRESGRALMQRLARGLDDARDLAAWRSQVAVSGGCGTALHTCAYAEALADALAQIRA